MKILFDQGTPVPLRRFLPGHTVDTCAEHGWSHQNLRYQQNMTGRRMAILVLLSTSWPRIQLRAPEIAAAADAARPGDYREFSV